MIVEEMEAATSNATMSHWTLLPPALQLWNDEYLQARLNLAQLECHGRDFHNRIILLIYPPPSVLNCSICHSPEWQIEHITLEALKYVLYKPRDQRGFFNLKSS